MSFAAVITCRSTEAVPGPPVVELAPLVERCGLLRRPDKVRGRKALDWRDLYILLMAPIRLVRAVGAAR